MLHLEAPILRVTGFDTPFPYTLEHEYLPDADRILDAIARRRLEWCRWRSSSSCRTSAKAWSRARSSRWQVEGATMRQARPADGRGDDRQGDGGDPRAARRPRCSKRMYAEGQICPVGKVLVVHRGERRRAARRPPAGDDGTTAGHGQRPSATPPPTAAACAGHAATCARPRPRRRSTSTARTSALGATRVLATPATRKLARELGVDLGAGRRRPGRPGGSPRTTCGRMPRAAPTAAARRRRAPGRRRFSAAPTARRAGADVRVPFRGCAGGSPSTW